MKDRNINISSLKWGFKNLRHSFWAHKYRSTIQQKLIQKFFYNKKLELLEMTEEKNRKKATLKIERYVYYIFTENICSACNPMQVVVFWKNLVIL